MSKIRGFGPLRHRLSAGAGFADENGIRFVATNVPRRYARMVSKVGLGVLDSLDKAACQYLPPLPVEVDYDEGVYVYIGGESFKQMGGMPMKKSSVRKSGRCAGSEGCDDGLFHRP